MGEGSLRVVTPPDLDDLTPTLNGEKMKREHIIWFDKQTDLIQDLREHTAEMYDMLVVEPTPPRPAPPDPDRKDTPWWPQRFKTAGAVAFPLTLRPREYIRKLVQHLQAHGYNSVSVGAQSWTPAQAKRAPMLPPGPPVGGAEWAKNLETMLDETARHENFFVQLIPTFGHKQYDTDPDGQEMAWHLNHARKINAIIQAGGYKHVFIDVMNEFKHPLTDDDLGDTDITRLGDFWQNAGFKVTSDHGGREKVAGERIWKAYYPKAWQGFDFYAWHPTRNPEPTKNQFQKANDRWPGKALLYNETVCYASDETLRQWPKLRGKHTIACKGMKTEDDRKQAVRDIKRHIEAAGPRSRFFFHSIWLGIRGGLDTPLGWMPVY